MHCTTIVNNPLILMSLLNQLESFYIIPLDGAQSIHFLLLAKYTPIGE